MGSDAGVRLSFAAISMSSRTAVPAEIVVPDVIGAAPTEVAPVALTGMGFEGSFVRYIIFGIGG